MIKFDVEDVVGSTQLCAGQPAGAEAVVHTMRELLKNDTEAVFLVDVSNAFNGMDRMVELHNIHRLCPSIVTILINMYRNPTELFVGGTSILFQEGTTQGEPLGMPMYAMATIPLIKNLPRSAIQSWYANDAAAAGSISSLRI